MNEPGRAAPASFGPADPSRTTWTAIAADPVGATRARTELARWLQAHVVLGEDRLGDVVLAVYEALANAVEAAPGSESTMDVDVRHDLTRRRLTVAVVDRGVWRSPTAALAAMPMAQRGRGIPLMRALADQVRHDVTEGATTVTLIWNAVGAAKTPGS